MSGTCRNCTHPSYDHDDTDGRCFAAPAQGKARPCKCDACAEAEVRWGHPRRCGCRQYVASGGSA